VVEPRLSDQWFVRMKPLAEKALDALRTGELRILPDRWEAVYVNWLDGIRDWNISRQIWWGHRVPVWYCEAGHAPIASRTDITACPVCGGPVRQDEDVLDTWFSSWLWPMSTLGWPNENAEDLKAFYPGDVLVTAPEILFFWVARMIMAGYHFRGRKPFTTVYLHGTARDTKHRRMSKSLGNGIDPLDVVKLTGADALRWTLIAGSSLGADVVLDPNDLEATFAPGRNFANKLWNIGRFVLAQLAESADTTGSPSAAAQRAPAAPGDPVAPAEALTLVDRWILSRLQSTIRDVTDAFEQFRLDEGAKRCFDFVWHDLADWYVEAVKPRLAASGAPPEAAGARWVLTYCFDSALRLLHPVVPFITEELWQKLPGRQANELLAVAPWPERRAEFEDATAEGQFERVKQAIERIRAIRADYRVPPKTRLKAAIVSRSADGSDAFAGERDTIMRLGQLEGLALAKQPNGAGAHAVLGDGTEVFVALEGAIDLGQECRRLSTERERLDQLLKGLTAKLSNENFVARAPADVVAKEREKEREWRFQRDVLDSKLKSLGCS
jgi:valyl-tRNA synthetase